MSSFHLFCSLVSFLFHCLFFQICIFSLQISIQNLFVILLKRTVPLLLSCKFLRTLFSQNSSGRLLLPISMNDIGMIMDYDYCQLQFFATYHYISQILIPIHLMSKVKQDASLLRSPVFSLLTLPKVKKYHIIEI